MYRVKPKTRLTHSVTVFSYVLCVTLALTLLTLILNLDPDIMKMYLCTKMKFVGQDFQMLEPEHDRQTDKQTPRRIRWL